VVHGERADVLRLVLDSDAVVVACAEPDGVVLTSDVRDLRALASHALGVAVERA
jgi:hypothetical protein